jgi:hypothetical protein
MFDNSSAELCAACWPPAVWLPGRRTLVTGTPSGWRPTKTSSVQVRLLLAPPSLLDCGGCSGMDAAAAEALGSI